MSEPSSASQPLIAGQHQIQSWLEQALGFHQLGELSAAQTLYEQILEAQPHDFAGLYLFGVLCAQTRRFDQALDLLSRACTANPANRVGQFNRARVLQDLNRLEDAIAAYDQAISLDPQYAQAYCNRGLSLQALGRFDEALASYDKAIGIEPHYPEAHFNRGNLLREIGRRDLALESYDQAIALAPSYADPLMNKAVVLHEIKAFEAAVAHYDQAIALQPGNATIYSNRGNSLFELNRLQDAVDSFNQAIEIAPEYAEAYSARSLALQQLGRLDDALSSCEMAVNLKPSYADAYNNRASILGALRRWSHALTDYDHALRLKPEQAVIYLRRGIALMELTRVDEAIESFERAISIDPELGDAHLNRGMLLFRLKAFPEAAASFARAIELQPDAASIVGLYQHTKMYMCDWDDFEGGIQRIENEVLGQHRWVPTFALLTLTDKPDVQKRCSEVFAAESYPSNDVLGPIPRRSRQKKIRIGYFSSDLRQHAMGRCLVEFFERHDKSIFEIVGFSFSPRAPDDLQLRIQKAFNEFIDITRLSDQAVASLSREKQIDIAVDLNGFTGYCRTNIFAHRAAPVQLQYLGYPGTMGTSYIDYLIADHTVIPDEFKSNYSEKIVRLPASYQVSDRQRYVSDTPLSKADFGLPEQGFIFCCFNSVHKITPTSFDSWMRILHHVEGSVLWLIEDNAVSVERRKREAEKRGIAASRLIFAPIAPLAQYLDRQRLADLFLDTLPYNAHATASDALWSGLPVLTLSGQSFASRVGASLLNALDLPELVTTRVEDYEQRAISLATEPGKIEAIKQKLARNRMSSSLFNTDQTTRYIEAGYVEMMKRYWAGLEPTDIDVAI